MVASTGCQTIQLLQMELPAKLLKLYPRGSPTAVSLAPILAAVIPEWLLRCPSQGPQRSTPGPEFKMLQGCDPTWGQPPSPVSKALLSGETGEAPFGRVIAAQQRCPPPSVGEVLVFGDLSVPLLR